MVAVKEETQANSCYSVTAASFLASYMLMLTSCLSSPVKVSLSRGDTAHKADKRQRRAI